MLSNAVVHPMLPAADIARARKYYNEVLGLEMLGEDESTVAYQCGSGTVLFVYPSANAGTNQGTAAEFEVPDVDATKGALERRGVAFEDYDMPGLKTTNGVLSLPSGGKVAWFKDSEGNILSITQRAHQPAGR